MSCGRTPASVATGRTRRQRSRFCATGGATPEASGGSTPRPAVPGGPQKDVIITGGENVYSPEVEDAVSGLAEVAACAVVGTPDDRWGEAVCAVVVPRSGATLTLAAVQDFVRGRLAGYKMPRRLVIVDDLPILASGKVDKKRLRAELAAG